MTKQTLQAKDLSLTAFDAIDSVFSIKGDDMRVHRGRSVVAVKIDGERHFLKRFWYDLRRPFKRNVMRGSHELRMIDWLCGHGFNGPSVIRRGRNGYGPFSSQMFFLMREVPGENALETAWRLDQDGARSLLKDLATFAATLHDAGFCHTDFSERHIFVGGSGRARSFRLIDVERAIVGAAGEHHYASDLSTLAASVMDERLRDEIRTRVVDLYIDARKTLSSSADFRSLFEQARPTKSF